MPKPKKSRPAPPAPLSGAERKAEDTRRALRRSVARAREIVRLSKQLQRLNDAGQVALLELARGVASDRQFDLVPFGERAGANG